MDVSFLLVTKGRPEDLKITLSKLSLIIDTNRHEVLVFIDGCYATEKLIPKYKWVNWTVSKDSKSASPARAILYQKAIGKLFIGLDDDAHPIGLDFISLVENIFEKDATIGIIAFQEVKGIYTSDQQALSAVLHGTSYMTNEFIGCGFAILKKVYDQTDGFPVWIDIYGEESAVAMEVMDLGYSIYFAHDVVVNHRVDRLKREEQGKNYFRFERQLRNSFRLFVVYYPEPLKIISILLFHNFKKYAMADFTYFKLYWKAVGNMLFNFSTIQKYRRPIQKSTQIRMRALKSMPY